MNITTKVFQVLSGDCMLVSYEDKSFNFSIIIDAGLVSSYHRTLKAVLKSQAIDLFILTHTDDDHIKGMTPLMLEFENPPIKQFLYNYSHKDIVLLNGFSSKKSIPSGIKLRDYLIGLNKVNIEPVVMGEVRNFENKITIKVLSPSVKSLAKFIDKWEAKEPQISFKKSKVIKDRDCNIDDFEFKDFKDSSLENGSSIAFLTEIENFAALFLSDAHHEVIVEGLNHFGYDVNNKLILNYCKLSHHGSITGISQKLLETIECENYIISSNGSKKGSISKEALARIVKYRYPKHTCFIFNYKNEVTSNIFSDLDKAKYHISSKFPEEGKNFVKILYTDYE